MDESTTLINEPRTGEAPTRSGGASSITYASVLLPPYPATQYGKSGGGSALPGSGTAPPGCGDPLVTRVCREPHPDGIARARVVRQECRDRICPLCAGPCVRKCPVKLPSHPGGTWAHREGIAASERWEDYLEQYDLDHTPVRQVIVSVPPERFSEDGDHADVISTLRSMSQRLGTRWAWRSSTAGGTCVVHLYRGCEGDYTRWGPHAHLTCVGIRTRDVADYQARYGVVVKQVVDRGGRWASYRGRALARHLVYELGHASIIERGHALTWWGDLHAWRQPHEDRGPSTTPACPSCGTLMREAIWDYDLLDTFQGPKLAWTGCAGPEYLSVVLVPGPPVRLRKVKLDPLEKTPV